MALVRDAGLVDILGGGPAGAMAAIAAARAGAPAVRIYEKTPFPRHKVCGEFLSPEILPILRRAGCVDAFMRLNPASIRELRLHFNSRPAIHRKLPQPAFGLSRYALDRLLLDHAASIDGVQMVRETAAAARILASGRKSVAPAGNRLFGFKAHFQNGPVNDAVELYFFDDCYVGVSAIEGGATNVCGLASEPLLRAARFDPAGILQRSTPLSRRLEGLTRRMDWLVTGPLVFSEQIIQDPSASVYAAGDALGFIDPFTGSGILNAMLTGELAGCAAAAGIPVAKYCSDCRSLLRRPFLVSSIFRAAIGSGFAGLLAPLVPGRLLFHATRVAAPS